MLFTATKDNQILIFSFNTGTIINQFAAHDNSISGVCVSWDFLITSSLDTTIKFWDISKFDSAPQLFYDHEEEIISIDISDSELEEQFLVSLDTDWTMIVRSLKNPREVLHKINGPYHPDEEGNEVEHGLVWFIQGQNNKFFLVLN